MKTTAMILLISLITFSCKDTADRADAYDSKEAAIDSMKIEMAKQEAELARQKSIDSMKAVQAAKSSKTVERAAISHRTASYEPTANASTGTTAKKKKELSGAAKGAIIGAGVGAVGGAIINKKNPGAGAVIGGVAGAGVGAGAGAILESDEKKAERRANR